jgi:putative ABC transport system permease protein
MFGNKSALGQTILVDNTSPLQVGAVIRDVPQNSSIQFDVLLPLVMESPFHRADLFC